MKKVSISLYAGVAAILLGFTFHAAAALEIEAVATGDWRVEARVKSPGGEVIAATFEVELPQKISIKDEHCESLPDFNPKAWAGWAKGYALKGVRAQECSVKGLLSPNSLKVTDGTDAKSYQAGKDYDADLEWGSVGRLPDGAIAKKGSITVSYDYYPQRIDTIVLTADKKKLILKRGTPDVSQPKPTSLAEGEVPVVNIHISGAIAKLTRNNIFVILETTFPSELAVKDAGVAAKLLPKTMKKLREGGHLKILAWGDSVTDGGFLQQKEKDGWQAQFVSRLKERYPKADIELVTEAWPGHNTGQYLAEPAEALHNYKETVLGAKADLVIMEFINDSWLKTAEVNERYGMFLTDFKSIGAEWIVNTPHYMYPPAMGLSSQRDIDVDPREYVKALREFAAKNDVALADASLRYGRLWRQGIPFLTLYQNAFNHPNPQGMAIYSDALINLFP